MVSKGDQGFKRKEVRPEKELKLPPPPPPPRLKEDTSRRETPTAPLERLEVGEGVYWKMWKIPRDKCPVVAELLDAALYEYKKHYDKDLPARHRITGCAVKEMGGVRLKASYKGRGLSGRGQFYVSAWDGDEQKRFETPRKMEEFLKTRGIGNGGIKSVFD